jgi:hypothetical protein
VNPRLIVTGAASVGVSIAAACCAAYADGAIAALVIALAAAVPICWVLGAEPGRAAIRVHAATIEGAARAPRLPWLGSVDAGSG